MKYFVDGNQVSQIEFNDTLRTATYNQCLDSFIQMLDTMYPDVEIESTIFKASVILKFCAPSKYNQMLTERVDFVYAGYIQKFEKQTAAVVDRVMFYTMD